MFCVECWNGEVIRKYWVLRTVCFFFKFKWKQELISNLNYYSKLHVYRIWLKTETIGKFFLLLLLMIVLIVPVVSTLSTNWLILYSVLWLSFKLLNNKYVLQCTCTYGIVTHGFTAQGGGGQLHQVKYGKIQVVWGKYKYCIIAMITEDDWG